MKNFVRIGSLVLALGLLAGCASHRSSHTARRSNDFEVVETSTKRLLTPQEMLQLKIAVAKYLDKEGAVASGDYYVKIFLGPDQDGVPADWVVVRFTRDSNSRFALVAAYPAGSPGYRSYAAYDYYPYGYDHFSRISFQYYDDPFYGSRYYFPPRRHDRDHDRKHDHDRDHDKDPKHDRKHDHDRDHDRAGDTARPADRHRFKPIDPVGSPPQVTRTRGDGDRRDGNSSWRDRHPRGDNTPQPEATSASQTDRQPATRSDLHRREAPRNDSIRTSSQAAPRTESSRSEPTRSEPSFRTSSQSAPSYSPPATRSEPSYSAPRSESRSESHSSFKESQREASQSDGPRERPGRSE